MQYDVFVSYESDSSLNFVVQLVNWFEKQDNIKCWYAPRNLDNTGAGKDYDDEIVEAIQQSRCIVAILNDQALQSKWVKREIAQAEKQGKMIFPFVVSKLTINNGLLMRLEDKHLISAYPEPMAKYPLLLKNVKQFLGQDTSSIVIKESIVEDSQQKTQSSFKFDIDFDEGMALFEVNEQRDAFYAFMRSAENGNKQAEEYLYQIMLENNKDVNFIKESTWAHIEELSDEGRTFADMLMHYRYFGMGTQDDIAIKYLKRSMSKEVSYHAFLQLGICYEWGCGVQTNNVLALHYYNKAFELGCKDACMYIGQLYTVGGDKVKKDYEKAEEYIRKGIKLGSKRCYSKLFWLLAEKGDWTAAQNIAEEMISHNYNIGFVLMGDYYGCHKNDGGEAGKWYEKAARLGVKEAWGKLAMIKRYYDYEPEEAYKLAKKGCSENDHFSYHILGNFYEIDNKYDKAWEYYYNRVIKFGVGAEALGYLYLELGYKPKDYSIDNLKIELRKDNSNINSIKHLLRIILKENNRQDVLSYEQLKEVPETYEYLRLAANLGDAELSFIYGKISIESEGKDYNSYSGIEFVESAAMQANSDALKYALDYYDKNSDSTKLSLLSSVAIKENVFVEGFEEIVARNYDETAWETLLQWFINIIDKDNNKKLISLFEDKLTESNDKDAERFAEWIAEKVQDGNIVNPELKFCLYNAYLKTSQQTLQEQIIKNIRETIQSVENREVTQHILLGKVIEFMSLIFPDYSPKEIMEGDFSNERDLNYTFAQSKYFDGYLPNGEKEIPIEKNIYDYLLQHTSPEEIISIELHDNIYNNNFYLSYKEFIKNCKIICEKAGIQPVETVELKLNEIVPYSSDDVLYKYCLIAFKTLISCKKAFGKYWTDISCELNDDNKLINIIETIKDVDIQAALIYYIEIKVEANRIYYQNRFLRDCIHNDNRNAIAEYLNNIISYLNSKDIPCSISNIDAESLPMSTFKS